MSTPDPEDAARRDETASGRPADARQFSEPADVDAAFAAIVADWAASDAPRWPVVPDDGPSSGIGLATPPQGQPSAHPERPADELFTPAAEPEPVRPTPPPAAHRPHPTPAEDDHFVPPEPPPLPRIGLSSLFGLLLLVAGVVLLALPALVGGIAGLGIVPGLLAMAAGLGWLVVGMRRPSERDDDGML